MSSTGLTKEAQHAAWRADVLQQCKEADAAWKKKPGRNLILLFDGTGNILGFGGQTNVIKLMKRLKKVTPFRDNVEQIVYYDPGVGTNNEFPPAGKLALALAKLKQVTDLAIGQGAFQNIADGYDFLCREYIGGDRIWLFGFSRGAFTARAVGGMVNMYGLTYSSCLPMVRTLVRVYFADDSDERTEFAEDIIKHFSLGRTPLIHFTGVWDTVESIGLTGGLKITNSSILEHKRFVHVRHAVSLHENRSKYKPRLYTKPQFTQEECALRSFEQTWFRGVHSDVGGSYKEDGLSNIALNWMIQEAGGELEFAEEGSFSEAPNQPLHDQTMECPYWILSGVNTRERIDRAQLHPTAAPVGDAMPAKRSEPWWHWPLFGLAILGLAIVCFASSPQCACLLREGPTWLATLFSASSIEQFSNVSEQCWNANSPGTGWWVATLVFLWLSLPYPISWSLRRWSAAAVVEGTKLPVVAAWVHLSLWGLLVLDVLENVAFTWVDSAEGVYWRTLAFLGMKAVCLVWILLVFGLGALRARPPHSANQTPQTADA